MKINATTAQRMFPRRKFGSLPEIDQFIQQGEKIEGRTQPDPQQRWIADSRPFPNLTAAREYIRDTLEIRCLEELGSPTLYTPATGYKQQSKTKGNIMTTVTPEVEAPVVSEPVVTKRKPGRPPGKGAKAVTKVASKKEYHARYEVTFPVTKQGRPVSVKVNDLDSLDKVIEMIKKHNL